MDHALIRRINNHPITHTVHISCDELGCADTDLIVTAVSGGGDSTALAALIAPYALENRCDHTIAYFDHGVDPERHEKEWEHVADIARRLGARSVRGDIRRYEHLSGEGPEDRWRKQRYTFLREVAGKTGTILTAHSIEDNAESFLMAALRGGPGSGLRGIRTSRVDRIRRPLLSIHRSALRSFLRAVNLTWIEDPTNTDISGTRNYIRQRIIPQLCDRFGAAVITGLHRSALTCDRDNDFIDDVLRNRINSIVSEYKSGERILDLAVYEKYHEAIKHRVLLYIFDQVYRGERVSILPHIEGLKQVIRGETRAISLPRGVQVNREGPRIVIIPSDFKSKVSAIRQPLAIPGWTSLPGLGGGILTTLIWSPPGHMPAPPRDLNSAIIDMDELNAPLYLRNRRRGERFIPLGFRNGKVKLKKYLRDRGMPISQRWSFPIVSERVSGRLVWIPGIARSNVACITGRTKRHLRLRFVSFGSSRLTYR